MTRLPSIALVVAALIASSSCTKSDSKFDTRRPAKKRLVIGITQEPDTLFMPFKEMNASEHIGRATALMLTAFDEAWQLQPQAAVTIPTVDNGGVVINDDGSMSVTWTLKEGLYWADGVPVTADDYVFGFEVTRDKDLPVVDRATVARVKEMHATDAHTFVVTWREPYAYYSYIRVHEALPRHALGEVYAKDKQQLGKESKPLLGGAFAIAEWVPQSHITLKRNPHAVAFAPKLDEIVWKIIPQTQTLEAAYLSGAIDVISVIGLTFDQALDFAARHPEHDVRIVPAVQIEHIDLNLENDVLKDRRVRQALMYAIDRDALVQALFNGKLKVAHSSEPDDNDDPGVVRYAYDPERARRLLDDAGFVLEDEVGSPAGRRLVVGEDGVRRRGDTPLRFTIHSTAGDRLREQVEQLLVDWWRQVGVQVTVQNQPAKLLFGDTIRKRHFESMVLFTWTKDPNKIEETFWRCDQKPHDGNAWQGRNYPGFCDARVDALLDEAQRTLDPHARRALHRQVSKILSEELPMLPLFHRADVSVVPRGLSGWRPTGVLQSVAWNAHEWEVDRQAQAR